MFIQPIQRRVVIEINMLRRYASTRLFSSALSFEMKAEPRDDKNEFLRLRHELISNL